MTGLTPVFKNNTLNLVCYQSYGQLENFGEEGPVICDDDVTSSSQQIDTYTFLLTTCVQVNEGGIASNDCVEECTTETITNDPCDFGSPSYDEEACNNDDDEGDCPGITCPSGFELDQYCNCNESQQPCSTTCPEGYRQTADCGCEPVPPPSCTTTCGVGYKLVNCNCIPCPTSCPTGYTLVNCSCNFTPPPIPEECDQAATAAGIATNNIINNINVQSALANLPAFTDSSQHEFGFTIKNTNGTIETTPMNEGTSTGVTITGYTINTKADVHTHPIGGAYAPSATDLFRLNNLRSQIGGFTTSFIKSSDGNIYALYINDSTKLSNFVNNNPGFVASNNNFNSQTVIGKLFWDTNNDLMQAGYTSEEAYTRATAFVLQDAGVTLLKSSATTINFKKIDLKEDIPAIDPNGVPVYSSIDCN